MNGNFFGVMDEAKRMEIEKRRRAKWQTQMSVFIVAVVVNYLWELAQAPFYVGLEDYNAAVFWHCFVATLGDGVMVLLIVAVGWSFFQRWDWFERPGVIGYFVMLTAGLVLAVLVEWVALYILGRWQYTVKMPTVSGLGIGVAPIAQMLVLPPLIFRIVTVFDERRA